MLRIVVYGDAEPSGSKTKTRWGIREDNLRAADYRTKVAQEAGREMARLGVGLAGRPQALVLDVTVYRRRPKDHYTTRGLSAKGQREPFPTTKPDRGKLLRTIEDALTGIVYEDDAQVVGGVVAKAWALESDPARVEILVWLMAKGGYHEEVAIGVPADRLDPDAIFSPAPLDHITLGGGAREEPTP